MLSDTSSLRHVNFYVTNWYLFFDYNCWYIGEDYNRPKHHFFKSCDYVKRPEFITSRWNYYDGRRSLTWKVFLRTRMQCRGPNIPCSRISDKISACYLDKHNKSASACKLGWTGRNCYTKAEICWGEFDIEVGERYYYSNNKKYTFRESHICTPEEKKRKLDQENKKRIEDAAHANTSLYNAAIVLGSILPFLLPCFHGMFKLWCCRGGDNEANEASELSRADRLRHNGAISSEGKIISAEEKQFDQEYEEDMHSCARIYSLHFYVGKLTVLLFTMKS